MSCFATVADLMMVEIKGSSVFDNSIEKGEEVCINEEILHADLAKGRTD